MPYGQSFANAHFKLGLRSKSKGEKHHGTFKKNSIHRKKDRVIYLLLNPVTKEFFISHCQKNLIIEVFRHHYYGQRYQTKECVEDLKTENLHPCLFVLEEINSTKVEAYNYVIAWTKILLEAGYTNLNEGNILNYILELNENNLLIYTKRKTIDIENKLKCCNCLVVNYNRIQCPRYGGIKNVIGLDNRKIYDHDIVSNGKHQGEVYWNYGYNGWMVSVMNDSYSFYDTKLNNTYKISE